MTYIANEAIKEIPRQLKRIADALEGFGRLLEESQKPMMVDVDQATLERSYTLGFNAAVSAIRSQVDESLTEAFDFDNFIKGI